MAPPGDVLAPSALWLEGAAVAEDVLGSGGVCGFQGLSLSEAAVATNKAGARPVKGRAGNKEEVVKLKTEAGRFKPVAVADVEEAPATGCGIKGEAEAGCFKPVAVADVEEAPATGGGIKGKVEAGCFKPVAVAGDDVEEAGFICPDSPCFRPEGFAGDAGDESSTKNKRVHALPAEEVKWILAQKPFPFTPRHDRETLLKFYPPEMIDRIIETEREADEAGEAIQRDFFAFQDWVRKEQDKYRVVMVDDEFLERRERTRQFVKEQFEEVCDRWEDDVSVVGNYSDLYATDDEEDLEGVLVDDLSTAYSEPEMDFVTREEFDRMDNESSGSEFGNYSDIYATDEEEDEEEEVALESTSS